MPIHVGAIGGGERFSDGINNTIIYQIFCTGNESKWSNCSYTIETNDLVCGDIQDAHVVCQGMELLEISMMYIHVCMYIYVC